MEINGKIYRNLEGQVGYLTEKWDDLQDQINDVRAHLTHYVIVDALPTEDIDTSAVYLVGPLGTAPDTYYEEWVYVETSEGTWSWEKLGDTDSVDLSGYLEKITGVTTYDQVYVKKADGTQGVVDAVNDNYTANSIARRDSGGRLKSANPVSWNDVVIKDYAENNFVAKDTTTTPYAKAYIKKADSTQDTVSISSTPNQGFIVQYNTGGTLRCKDPTGNGEEAVNLSYANDHYVAKQTSTSTYFQAYCKNTDGSQAMCNANVTVLGGAIPLRRPSGSLVVPLLPTADDDAASKKYVDDCVGQLLYLHDIDLTITIDSTNKLFIKAYLVNGSPTAITTFDRILYKRLDLQWGGFGPSSDHAVPAAVTKMPDGFRQDDFEEPLIGFLYQYFSGGNLVSAQTNSSMTTTITDVVISW